MKDVLDPNNNSLSPLGLLLRRQQAQAQTPATPPQPTMQMPLNNAPRPDMSALYRAQMQMPQAGPGYQNYLDQFYQMIYGGRR